MSDVEYCTRCNGSGEIGKRTRGEREAPGPVPDDARGWIVLTCPDCKGMGAYEIGLEEEEEL
jgi:DnaJ-class molecular chaperone